MSERNLNLIREAVKDLSAEDELDFLRAYAGGTCNILGTSQIHSLVMTSAITLELAKSIPRTGDKQFTQPRDAKFDTCPGCRSNDKSIRHVVRASVGSSTPCLHPWHD